MKKKSPAKATVPVPVSAPKKIKAAQSIVPAPKKITTAFDLQLDPGNVNSHTPGGMQMLENSIQKFGLGRSVVADRNGVLIAGNATMETALSAGMSKVIVVPTDGSQIVVVQRTDLNMLDDADGRAHGLAVADNTTARANFALDPVALRHVAGEHPVVQDFVPDWIMASIELAPDVRDSPPEEEHGGTNDPALSDVSANVSEKTSVGSYRFVVPRDTYLRWVEELRAEAGMQPEQQLATIRERLGL